MSLPDPAPPEWLEEYETFPKGVKTMQDFYLYTDKKQGPRPFAGIIHPSRDGRVTWYTRHEVHQLALSVGTRLLELGIEPGA
jgi:hypothetical protein